MNTVDHLRPRITDAKFEADTMLVVISDGRILRVQLQAFPALRNATIAARGYWRLAPGGQGLYWPSINQDISLAGMLADV